MIVTLTLNPSLDYMMNLDELSLGKVNRAQGEALYPGGKGINVSLMLHRMGIPSRCLGFQAGETGELLCRMLRREGITPEFIPVAGQLTRINLKLPGVQGTELNGKGPVPTSAEWEQLFSQLEGLKPGDLLVTSGRIPEESHRLFSLLQSLSQKGVLLAVDSSGTALERLMALSPFLAKPNLQELEQLTGKALPTLSQQIQAGKAFWKQGNEREYGATHLLLSLGSRGAVLFWGGETGEIWFLSPPEGKAESPVGAGDSMLAGWLAGWIRGLSGKSLLRLGVSWGSATAFHPWLAEKGAEITHEPILMEE